MLGNNNRFSAWLKGARRNTTLIGIIVVLILGTAVNGGVFLSVNNIANVGRQATLRGILACGIALPNAVAYLKNGAVEKVSLEAAQAVLEFLETRQQL